MFSRSDPVARGQLAAQTPQQMFEQVQRYKEAADWYKREDQAVEAEKHYKVAQELVEEVMKTTSIDFQTSKVFESIYSEYSGLLKALGRTSEAAILDQKKRTLFERDKASGASSRKREVERGSSSEHLNKKNYAAILELRSAQRVPDTVLSSGLNSASISLQHPVASSAEGKSAQVDYLFEKALSTLGSLEVSNKPSLFLVYAHDNPDHGEAKASTSKDLIKQLSKIQVILYSDQAPMAQPYSSSREELQEDARLENILSNQLCLLPTQLKKGVKPVDKVVVCCSAVLGSYLKWSDYKEFHQKLQTAYLEDRKAYLEDDEQASAVAIRQVVRKFSQAPAYKAGFHHVLTEMAFLEIRAEERGEDKHGIIPVSLTPDSYAQCLGRFITSTTVRMEDMLRFDRNSKAEQDVHAHQKSQHIVLFKLIDRLLASSDEAKTFLSTFWKAYTEFVSEPLTPGGLEFTRLVDAIFDDIRTALHSQLARDLPQMRMLHTEIQKKLLTSNLSLIDLRKALYQHYQLSNLSIQRVSGDKASLDDCYINLAIVESQAQREKDKKELEKQAATFERLPSSERLEATNPNKLIELEKLFETQKLRNGSEGVPKRILIQGRAGIGKTTLCKKLVYEYHENGLWQDRFESVLWVPLRQLKTRAPKCLEDLLCNQYFVGYESSQAQALSKVLHAHQGKTLFILDGLDEVASELRGENQLGTFLRVLLAKEHVVITSRPTGVNVNELNKLDLELETVGFSQANVQAYIQKFAPEFQQTAIKRFIKEMPLIQGLVNIPIQLDALCYSWDKLPKGQEVTMAMLYQAIIDKLWRKDSIRLEKKEEGQLLEPHEIEDLSEFELEEVMAAEINYLSYLAFKGLEAEKIEFSRQELSQRKNELNKISFTRKKLPLNFTTNLKKTSYLHTADASRPESERHYHFLHLTFQEFFAAKFLVQRLQAEAKLEGTPILEKVNATGLGAVPNQEGFEAFIALHKYNPRYEIVWWMVAGLLEGAELECFFTLLRTAPRDLIGMRHQQVMVGCLNEARARLTQWNKEIVSKLEKELMQWLHFELKLKDGPSTLGCQTAFPERLLFKCLDESVVPKDKIFNTLGERVILSDVAVKTLIDALKDRERDVRSSAASALEKQKMLSDAAVEALIDALKHKIWYVRTAAANVLGHQATLSGEVVEALISALKDQDRDVRATAASALEKQKTLSQLAVDALSSVRMTVTNALEVQGGMPQTTVKAEALKDENWLTEDARSVAVYALGKQEALSDADLGTLSGNLKRKDWYAKVKAVRALGGQSPLSEAAVQALIGACQDNNRIVRSAAARALGGQSPLSEAAVQALIGACQDNNRIVRSAAARALGRQSSLSEAAVQALIGALQHKNKDVRSTATRVLGGQNPLSEATVQALIGALQHKNKDVRSTAASVLGGQSPLSEAAVQALIGACQDNDRIVRSAAASALGGRSTLSEAAVRALIGALQHENEDVRSLAISVLEKQETLSDAAIEALSCTLKDQAWSVRTAAVRVLESKAMLSDRAVEALIGALKDQAWSVRTAAASALEKHETLSDTAVEVLSGALKNQAWDAKIAAARVLGRQKALPGAAVEALIGALKDQDRYVRATVNRALNAHLNQLFITFPSLASEQIKSLYTQFLFPLSCRETISLTIHQGNQLRLYTATEPGKSIELMSEQIEVMVKALRAVRAEVQIPILPEEERLLMEE
ncbi:HEAT repeat domain-containing protein [Mycoavidus sp. HKI]|uniref:HEAT repeat domain-containing protein n=1 Tax=Mycoavidus sp. HKI TaxID=2840467 RepID=UPI001CBA8C14|nr:HEAT repeat domain-containing protein [Mycoavidus sp. HKI]UAW64791.1 HEAT repeat domain-containing protein [Mycoavidus sp. HKI]